MSWRRKGTFVALFFALALCALSLMPLNVARADNLYASIRGTVSDPTGAGVPDVTVTATNVATGVTQQVTSASDGSFSFLQLAVGDYNVTANKAGFETFTAAKIHLELNQVYVVPIPLTLGAVSQEVTVQANGVQVDTTTTQLGTVVEAPQIVSLPLIGRNWQQLQQLQPGVVASSDRFGQDDMFATNGGESQFNMILIDGTDTNDLSLNTNTFVPSEDAISEFKMVTSTMSPEYARTSGAILNAVIKSGTNHFHGDAFDYYRDTFLDARNYFAASVSPFHENQFGGTLGGSIIKNHTFGFFSYQGIREGVPQTSNGVESGVQTTPVFASGQDTGTTPFAGLAASTNTSPFPLVGDDGVTYAAGTPYSTIFSTGVIPTADINSVASGLLKYIPAPNTTLGGAPAFTFNATEAESRNQYLYRIDQVFSSKDILWGTWFNETVDVTEPVSFFGGNLPGFGERDGEHFKFLTLSWSHVFNDHMVNELRGGYNRFNYAAGFPNPAVSPSAAGFSITPQDPAGAGLPLITVTGLFDLGFSPYGPQPRIDQLYQATDNFSIIEGRHTLKVGFDMRRWEELSPSLGYNSGEFAFRSYGTFSTGVPGADFLLGIPAWFTQGSGGLEDARTRQYYSYVQDEFRYRPNLTLIYGLGWTIDTPDINIAYDGHGQMAFRPGEQSTIFPGAPVGIVYQGDAGVSAAGPTQWKNFGPRLGLAYSPDWGWLTGGPGKTSIRAGFGIYYDKSETEQAGQVGFGVPPFATSTLSGVLGSGAPVLSINPGFANPYADIATGATVPNPYPFTGYPSNVDYATTPGLEPVFGPCCAVVAKKFLDPRMTNYNLTVQRQVGTNTIVTVGYVGSVARNLSYGMPINVVTGLDATNSPVFPYPIGVYGPIDTIFSGGNSNYNALQASIDKHVSNGLELLASYTWSRSFDDTSGFENSSFGEYGGQGGGYGGSIRASNPYCFPACDYAASVFDAPQRLVVSYVYQIPGMHGGAWWLGRLTQGWTISGITTFQEGFPVDIADLANPSGGCQEGDFSCWDGPDQIAPVHYMNPRSPGHPWFSASSFAPVPCSPVTGCPSIGISPTSVVAYGNAPRNPIRGPGLNNWDFALYKDTSINESMKIQLRMEAYNLFNHTQFNPDGLSTDLISAAITPSFGSISEAQNPRLMQLVAKFIF
jgi:Carboxypeptidase regulatory-like domain